jgi:peptidoglycan/LPS O-acetylase OafA/YrhL
LGDLFKNTWARGAHALFHETSEIPALDGLRTLAIFLVVISHCATQFVESGGSPNGLTRFPLVQGGWCGVDLFFVLSGFLIGRQLLRELTATGDIQISRFILRRGLRIWPLYFFIFAVCVGLRGLETSLSLRALWPEAFFLGNYFGGDLVPGSWSLAVEEQFYLTAPVVFAMAVWCWPQFRHRAGWIPALAFVAAPLVRALVWLPFVRAGQGDLAHELDHLYLPFHTHYDGLALGLVIASVPVPHRERWRSPLWVLSAVLLAGCLRWFNRPLFNYTGLALIFGSLVLQVLASSRGWLARLFAWRPFQISSRLSFGIYLWYRLLLPALSRWTGIHNPVLSSAVQYTLLTLLTLVAATTTGFVTYLLLEQPILRWRNQLLRQHKAHPKTKFQEITASS